jgi:three-Cys-motif partner protein
MLPFQFGGDWTTDKLGCLHDYLDAYTKIFTKNPKAQYFTRSYVDAFAGTGYRTIPILPLFESIKDPDAQSYLKGSAKIALEVEPPFHRYLFIDNDPLHIQELERLKSEFPSKANRIQIERADANIYLNRAVVFLDPYGMQVEWSLIEIIAKTKAIDLWWLFPLGVSINRLLTREEPPRDEWAASLTKTFGTDSWKDRFYPLRKAQTLFGEQDQQCKNADFEMLGDYIIERLKTIFFAVAEKPLQLCNSRNNPIYLLCFAAGNPKGASTAVKIASYILEKKGR